MTGYDNIEHASLSDVGVRRSHNQDSHAILLASDETKWHERGHVFVVADGMGAHAVGELASDLAVGIIPHTYHKHAHEGAVPALRKAFIEANASIHARGQQNREFEGMGTTGTALLLREEGAWIGHVGDSRAYRIRNGQIEQLSYDHSLIWEYARRQRVDPERVQGIPSNVIVRSLGPEPLVQVDVEGPHPLAQGDIFLLCSDGLSGQLTDHEVGAVASVLPPAEACRFLVDLANLRGGPDNITVVIVRVGSGPTSRGAAGLAKPRRPLLGGFPWPLAALLLGVLLAAGAIWLKVNGVEGGGFCFFLAAVALVAGIVGLLLDYLQEQRHRKEDVEHPRPKIHRRATCQIERGLLDKLIKATVALKQRADEKKWDVDETAYQQYFAAAEEALGREDLPAAFREYCRAMRPLAESLQRQRGKEEVFQPVWDKSDANAAANAKASETSSYKCQVCGKIVTAPKDLPPPACCDRPMKRIG